MNIHAGWNVFVAGVGKARCTSTRARANKVESETNETKITIQI
jgi:hypothetical protein